MDSIFTDEITAEKPEELNIVDMREGANERTEHKHKIGLSSEHHFKKQHLRVSETTNKQKTKAERKKI